MYYMYRKKLLGVNQLFIISIFLFVEILNFYWFFRRKFLESISNVIQIYTFLKFKCQLAK